MSLTIDSKITNALLDRLKNIVDGIIIRYDSNNSNLVEVFEALGSYDLDEATQVTVVVDTDGDEVTFNYKGSSSTHSYVNDGDTFTLFDTGYSLQVTSERLENLRAGDTYDIRMSTATETIVQVKAYDGQTSDEHLPCLTVYPAEFPQTNANVVNYRNVDANFGLHLEVDFEQIRDNANAVTILEMCGDIENEIQKDPRFHDDPDNPSSCLAIDSEITNKQLVLDEENPRVAGMMMTLSVEFRKSLKNSRSLKP